MQSVTPSATASTVPAALGTPVRPHRVTPENTAPTITAPTAAASSSRITQLLIPTIGVDAPVEVKGLDVTGEMQAPDAPEVVAWYDFSGQPGSQENVVFAGHLDYAGVGPAVFWRLAQVQPGDEIAVIEGDGNVFQYQVTSVRSYSATIDASQVVASTGKPTITLITCGGSFDYQTQAYNQRTVVSGTLVGSAHR